MSWSFEYRLFLQNSFFNCRASIYSVCLLIVVPHSYSNKVQILHYSSLLPLGKKWFSYGIDRSFLFSMLFLFFVVVVFCTRTELVHPSSFATGVILCSLQKGVSAATTLEDPLAPSSCLPAGWITWARPAFINSALQSPQPCAPAARQWVPQNPLRRSELVAVFFFSSVVFFFFFCV